MIAIYDQEKELRFLPPDIERIRPLAKGCIVIIRHDGEGWDIAYYKDGEQAQYVVDQIASAIERGDKLYRMPSVEEVEKALKNKVCNKVCDCESHKHQDGQVYINWQPKDKE